MMNSISHSNVLKSSLGSLVEGHRQNFFQAATCPTLETGDLLRYGRLLNGSDQSVWSPNPTQAPFFQTKLCPWEPPFPPLPHKIKLVSTL